MFSAATSSLGGGGLTIFTCFSMVFLPGLQSFRNRLVQCWFPHGVTHPTSKPTSVQAPLCIELQVLPGASSSTGFPQGHSLLQASTMVFRGLQGALCTGVRSSSSFSSDLGIAGLLLLQVLTALLWLLLCIRFPQPTLY